MGIIGEYSPCEAEPSGESEKDEFNDEVVFLSALNRKRFRVMGDSEEVDVPAAAPK